MSKAGGKIPLRVDCEKTGVSCRCPIYLAMRRRSAITSARYWDLLALFAARWSGIQKLPDLWVALLMLNPLDSFRIEALFALQQIPAEAANKTPLAGWWTAHAGVWFTAIAVMWSAAMTTLASHRMNRWEE
jgi:hypothetical protein